MERRATLDVAKLKVAVPPGIGDALWSMVKIQSIMQQGNYDACSVAIKDTKLNRGKDFLLHFDFIDEVTYEVFPIHPIGSEFSGLVSRGLAMLGTSLPVQPEFVEETGEYIYLESQQDFLDKYDWLLIANGHLERGNRLETWLPLFETNFNIGIENFKFTDEEEITAELLIKNRLDSHPFVVFYLGPKWGNTFNGHNRNSLWTLDDWHNTALLMLEHNPDLRFVLVGAQYDLDYTADFLAHCHYAKHYENFVGLTEIGATFALIKYAQFVLSYQSGIGIFSAYLGVPTACFWRPYNDSISPDFFLSFREEMVSAWAPPWALGLNPGIEGNYLPLIYTKCMPASIVHECIKRNWI